MRKKFIVLGALGLSLILGACGGGGGGGGDGPDQGSGTPDRYYFRLVHALSDAPTLVLKANEIAITAGIDYARASVMTSRGLGGTSATIEFALNAIAPEGQTIPDILTSQLDIEGNTEYAFVVTGQYDAPVMIPVVNPRRDRPFGGLFFQFVHAASNTGALDVYVTAPDADLASAAPFASLAPTGFSEALEIPYENRRIRLTEPGTLNVVFDSATLAFNDDPNDSTDGIEWLITIADNLFAGGSPVKLIVTDGEAAQQVLARDQQSAVRVFNASEDFPVVDVVIGDNFASPLATSLSYQERSPQGLLRAGRASLNFTEPGNPGTFVFEDTVSTGVGVEHLLFLLVDGDTLTSLVTGGEPRSVATEAWVRFINVAPDSEFFSVYMGETDNDPPLDADRQVRDLAYTRNSGYIRLPPGTYQVRMTERFYEGDDDPDQAEETTTIGPFEYDAPAGSVKTFLIMPPEVPEGPETLVMYDDLLP